MLNDTQIPAQRVPITDQADGPGPARPWFRFLNNLYNFVGLGNGVVPETSGGTGNVTYATGDLLYASAPNTLSRLPVPGVGNAAYLGTDATNTPQWIVVGYGQFLKTTTTGAAANTPVAITMDSTVYHQNVDIGTPTSRIYISNTGLHNIQFSVQLANTDTANPDDVLVWVKVNGSDLANSASHVTVPVKHSGRNGTAILAANTFYQFTAGQYFELYGMTVNGTSQVTTIAASGAPAYPQSPAVILTVNQIV